MKQNVCFLMSHSGIILQSKLLGHKMNIEVTFHAELFLPGYESFKGKDYVS